MNEHNPPTSFTTVGRGALAVVLLAGIALRIALGFRDHGIYWPDEIYQSLEPAHRLVYGYGLLAWEFIEGARNWALPGFIAGLMWVAQAVGLDQPEGYLGLIRVVFALIAGGTVWGSYRLARAYDASPLAAAAGAAVFALAAPFVYFGHRAMSENASALPVVLGLAFALTPKARRWKVWLGASLLGISVLLRLHNGVFCLGLLGILAGRRDWRALRESFAVLGVWAAIFGLLDWLTWGRWFHSALVYLQFNLVEGKAANWGTSPWHYYLRVLWTSAPWVSVLLGIGAALSARRAPGLLLTAVLFVVLHSATPHKEFRFLMPVVPVFCALAAMGLSWAAARFDRKVLPLGSALLFGAAAISGAQYQKLTFGQLGAYGDHDQKKNQSAWNDFGDVNRLLLAAHDEAGLCGIKVEVAHQAWTGGHSYLHREVPFYPHNGPARSSRRYNYVITWNRPNPPGRVAAHEGSLALVQLYPDCTPDPGYSWRLN